MSLRITVINMYRIAVLLHDVTSKCVVVFIPTSVLYVVQSLRLHWLSI